MRTSARARELAEKTGCTPEQAQQVINDAYDAVAAWREAGPNDDEALKRFLQTPFGRALQKALNERTRS